MRVQVHSDSPFLFVAFVSKRVPHRRTAHDKSCMWLQVTAMFSLCLPVPSYNLTLIAGLASEARVALAFIGSHTFPMLTARLTQSYSGRIQRGRRRSVQCPGRLLIQDQCDKALNPTASWLGCKLSVYSTLQQGDSMMPHSYRKCVCFFLLTWQCYYHWLMIMVQPFSAKPLQSFFTLNRAGKFYCPLLILNPFDLLTQIKRIDFFLHFKCCTDFS